MEGASDEISVPSRALLIREACLRMPAVLFWAMHPLQFGDMRHTGQPAALLRRVSGGHQCLNLTM